MRPVPIIGDDGAASLLAIAGKCPEGCFVEVGVYQGGSAWHLYQLAQEQGRSLFLYDTFDGIPYQGDIDVHKVGDFGDTSFEAVCQLMPRANVLRGIFPASMVRMPPVAFAHIDCDQYQAVADCIRVLTPLMAPGGAMVLDDAFCLAGATKALEDSGRAYTLTERGKALLRF